MLTTNEYMPASLCAANSFLSLPRALGRCEAVIAFKALFMSIKGYHVVDTR